MDEREKEKSLAAAAPPMTEDELLKINAIYPAYIFRCRRTREIWTTCCGRHETIAKREYPDNIAAVMDAEHQAEEVPVHYGCHVGYMSAIPRRKERITTPCPYCGREAWVKELGRTGKRNNLAAYRRVVVLRWHQNALWASAYYTSKKYNDASNLTGRPSWTFAKVYRFQPGKAVCANNYYWDQQWIDINDLTGRPRKLPIPFYEPFTHNSDEGMGYTIISPEEIDKSPLRYCQFESFAGKSYSSMRFLAVCCIYPRQVEMLMKSGLQEAVKDLVEGRKWNAAAFNWEEEDPLASFGLNRLEMKEFLATKRDLEILGFYKQFRRRKIRCRIGDIEQLSTSSPYKKLVTIVKLLKAHSIEPARWLAYIQQATQEANGKKKRKLLHTSELAQYWIDYVDAAKVIGFDLKNPLVQMPKGLIKKHDLATKAAVPILAARRAAELSANEKKRLEAVTVKYEFSTEKYLIRAPIDSAEIADEGKVLKHCVGGYAERHMKGKLTILFLRATADPHTPLATIEMNGARMVQIHGYNNDRGSRIHPKEKYAEILEPWQDWLSAGSKRDKDGNPIMPRKLAPAVQVAAG